MRYLVVQASRIELSCRSNCMMHVMRIDPVGVIWAIGMGKDARMQGWPIVQCALKVSHQLYHQQT